MLDLLHLTHIGDYFRIGQLVHNLVEVEHKLDNLFVLSVLIKNLAKEIQYKQELAMNNHVYH